MMLGVMWGMFVAAERYRPRQRRAHDEAAPAQAVIRASIACKLSG